MPEFVRHLKCTPEKFEYEAIRDNFASQETLSQFCELGKCQIYVNPNSTNYTFLNKRQTLKLCIWSLENCKASLPNSFPFIAGILDVETKGGRFQFDTKLLDLIKGIIRFVVFPSFVWRVNWKISTSLFSFSKQKATQSWWKLGVAPTWV